MSSAPIGEAEIICRAAPWENESRMRALFDALPAAIYTTDAEGRITFYNQAAAELWGRRPELGIEQWCGSWRLFWADGTPMPHDQCPMAMALQEQRPSRATEAFAERPDGTRIPFLAYPAPLWDETGRLTGAVNMLVDITERKRVEEKQRLMVAELDHRVRNTLAVVQAIAAQTLRHAGSPIDFVDGFGGRLRALARANGLLTGMWWQGADLLTLVRDQVLAGAADDHRISYLGPMVMLEPTLALHVALVLHELATNARKYGALSVPHGRLSVGWKIASNGAGRLQLHWKEGGGPKVTSPPGRGFGSVLIERCVWAHGGSVRCSYGDSGVTWDIQVPMPKDEVVGAGIEVAPRSMSDARGPERSSLSP